MGSGGGVEYGEVLGFEKGISCLPSHVLHEAIWDTKEYVRRQGHQHNRNLPRIPSEERPRSKSKPRAHCRAKYPPNAISGGPGMQAIFLDSGGKSGGTGVFLPQRTGTGLQPSKKPACSPVLLPVRVVQALNLNVHELGLQISRRQAGTKSNPKGGDSNSVKNNSRKEALTQSCAKSKNQIISPEIFLPKEWSY